MAKVVPFQLDFKDDLQPILESGKAVYLTDIAKTSFQVRVSELQSEDGVSLGTILYVWGVTPRDLGVTKE